MNTAIAIFVSLTIIAFATVALMAGKDQRTTSEKIRSECERSYQGQGEDAVLGCQKAMSDRLADDHERGRNNRTYDRIR
ncbi:hypothetical protein [Methylorubrum populi]|uniref:hypothetical protein n=1 Tax=Methylorubrum populi TaxID=223967 RepID=UPI000DB621ED|nr:hypothetical protein [Methylorubrum populi]PZP69552.1 MAG: hypothetical protein DI590_12755 [Methylorubrum populi]